ncbi:hypothetical protein, partial [Klebsiella pneumoniae]|uniref:hypothetical protein n=1 Tax=Klebsiella pneumoniae TaxID=573 RepID=UPI001B8ADE11
MDNVGLGELAEEAAGRDGFVAGDRSSRKVAERVALPGLTFAEEVRTLANLVLHLAHGLELLGEL